MRSEKKYGKKRWKELTKELRKFLVKHKLTSRDLHDLATSVAVDIQMDEDAAYEKKHGTEAIWVRIEKRGDAVLGRLAEVHGVEFTPRHQKHPKKKLR